MTFSHSSAMGRRVRAVTQHQCKAWLIASAVSLLMAGPAHTEMYISTAGNAPWGSISFSGSFGGGFSFTTDDQAYYLQQIGGEIYVAGLPESGQLQMRLYSSAADGTPQTWLSDISFTHEALVRYDTRLVFFVPTSQVVLAPNSTYSLILVPADASTNVAWSYTDISTGTHTDVPGSSWSISTYLPYGSDDSGWINMGGGAQHFQGEVHAIPVPEPTTFALLGGALLAGWALRRKRTC